MAIVLSVIFTLVLSGCATASKNYSWNDVKQVVEPEPYVPSGYLKVFTPTEDHSTSEDRYYLHTPYTVFTENGKKVRYVDNRQEEPEVVSLSPRKYVVKPDIGPATGVIIEDQKFTKVDLDK